MSLMLDSSISCLFASFVSVRRIRTWVMMWSMTCDPNPLLLLDVHGRETSIELVRDEGLHYDVSAKSVITTRCSSKGNLDLVSVV